MNILGIDPAGIYITLYRFNQSFINQGDATYVQIIHTDLYILGTIFQCGDVDIYVEDIPAGLLQKHAFAAYIHMATSMKRLVLIAVKRGRGKVIELDAKSAKKKRVPHTNEVIVGVYSKVEEAKRGQKFYISFRDRLEILRNSIGDMVKIKTR